MKININKIKDKKYSLWIILFLSSIIIILIIIITITPVDKNLKSTITHDGHGSFVFTNPILDCEIDKSLDNSNIFYKDVKNKVEELKNKYSLSVFSFYFRDLNNGEWVGVDEKEVFSPASLLKVPIFMALLNDAQTDQSILDKKITVMDTDFIKDVSPNIISKDLLEIGKEYTLLDVAKSMVDKSDNTAISIILRNIKQNSFNDVFKSIGVPLVSVGNDFEIRNKDYAGFFRVLFNASYLNREMSEKALLTLTQSDYVDGIIGGVPKNVVVAHKFGERNIEGTKGNIQLHDCGIVYYPNKPYIFCAMTHGDSFKDQTKAIKELSGYVYNIVDKN